MSLLLIFFTGFCSMIYELGLAQLMSSLFGNTILRYSSTLAIYIVSMGIGSFAFKSKGTRRNILLLYWAELAMGLLGMLAPFLFIVANYYLIQWLGFQNAGPVVLTLIYCYIGLCGFISGYEIPIINAIIGGDSKAEFNVKEESRILAFDYIGMFVASLMFPLILIPRFGVLLSFWLASMLSLVCGLLVLRFADFKISKKILISLALLFSINLVLLIFSQKLQVLLSELYGKSL